MIDKITSSPFFLIGVIVIVIALLLFIFKKIKGFLFFALIVAGLFGITSGSVDLSSAFSWFKDYLSEFFKMFIH